MTQAEAPEPKAPPLAAAAALVLIERSMSTSGRDLRLCIKAFNPGGLTAHQTVDVEGIYAGIDWDAGKLIMQPAKPLTWLRPEDVEAVHKSVRAGQSWHAYQADKRRLEQISEALGVKVASFGDAVREIHLLKARCAGLAPALETEPVDPKA